MAPISTRLIVIVQFTTNMHPTIPKAGERHQGAEIDLGQGALFAFYERGYQTSPP